MTWYVGNVPIVPRNYGLIVTSFLFTILSFITVSMRVYTRTVIVKNMGIDDYLMVGAVFGSIAFLVAVVYQIEYGLGDAVRLETIEDFLISLYATILAYNYTQLIVKFSILFQYKRIFRTPQARKIFLGLIAWLSVYALFCEGSCIFTCWPVAKYWNDFIPGGCIDRSTLHYFIAGFNIMNDIIILLAPVPYLRGLQVTKRAKLVLIGVFTCGSFACIVAIIRLYSLWLNNSVPIDQQPLVGVDIAIWSCLEINIAMICASVPALKALFIKIIPKLGSLQSHAKRYGNGTSGSMPLASFDNRGTRNDPHSAAEMGKMEIKVHQSIEMKALPVSDDDSEKNLVATSWMADCYSTTTKPKGAPHVKVEAGSSSEDDVSAAKDQNRSSKGTRIPLPRRSGQE